MDLKETQALGGDVGGHWYYRAKAAAMLRLLGDEPVDRVLDVGAGSGFFSRLLLAETPAAEAICVDPNYAGESTETVGAKPLRFVRSIDRFEGHLVLMMDVLEHVEDDLALLRYYVERVPPGTRFLITVPAFAWMWSGHDVFLGHYRRYTLAGLEALVGRAGLVRERSAYLYGATLPIAAAVRWGRKLLGARADVPKSDMRPHSALVNALLWTLSKAELPLFPRNRLAGLSVTCVARTR